MKNEIDNRKVANITHTVGLNNNLMDSQIREIVESQFRFTYKTIKSMGLSDMTDEEIDNLKTNFYYKYIGKLYTDKNIIARHRIQDEIIKQKIKNKEDGRSKEFGTEGSDDVNTNVSD